MKLNILLFILVLFIAMLLSCKKEPAAPTSGNKIEIGETKVDTVSYFEAKVSTSLANTGENEILQHGHCWSPENKPTTDDTKTTLGKLNAPKSYASQLADLDENTIYYIRSYVNYKYGTLYGDEQNINTLKTDKPVVSTIKVLDITLYSAKCIGDILTNGGLFVITKGFCWDTTNSFCISNCLDTTIVSSDTGSFISSLTGLNMGLKYFVKAYAINEKGIGYGNVKQFSTLTIILPEVTTTKITNISVNAATSGGNVTSNGNATVIARGVCWNLTGNPTLQNSTGHTTDGDGIGSFISEITDLNDEVTYFVSAYATNEKGTAYGEVKSFKTHELTLPTIETANITNITNNSATGGGNVTNDGNGTISTRGVCWNTTGNPTLENNNGYTSNGNGTGTFSSQLTGLTENITYYVAAYASNEKGTAYGQEESFVAKNDEFTDPRDGQTYITVVIGSQTWFAENLNYETENSWCYDNNGNNCNKYGRLYTWGAALTACPSSWHLPSDAEWKTLEMHLGMSYSEVDHTGWRGTDEGKKLKSTNGWDSGGNGTNEVSFTALPGGYRITSEYFINLGFDGFWWTATEYGSSSWSRRLGYDSHKTNRYHDINYYSYSVRCVKD